jgi:hypothetical protein
MFTTRWTKGLVLVGLSRELHYYYTAWKHQAVKHSVQWVHLYCVPWVLWWYSSLNHRWLKDAVYINTWKPTVCCFDHLRKNAFRMASSNSLRISESCARAYIEFLAEILSWSVDCTWET